LHPESVNDLVRVAAERADRDTWQLGWSTEQPLFP